MNGACTTTKQFPLSSSIRLLVTLANVSQLSVYSSKDLTSGGKEEIRGKTLNMGKNTERTDLAIFSLINRNA